MMMSSFRSKMLEPMSCENANPNFPPQGSKVFARPPSLCSGFQIFPFLNIWCFNNAGHGHGPHQIDMLAGSLIDLPWGTAYVEKSPEGVTSKISPWWWWWWYHCGDRKSPSSSSPSPPSSSRPVSKAPLAPARIIIIQWNIIIIIFIFVIITIIIIIIHHYDATRRCPNWPRTRGTRMDSPDGVGRPPRKIFRYYQQTSLL